jgi:hypothetical protein
MDEIEYEKLKRKLRLNWQIPQSIINYFQLLSGSWSSELTWEEEVKVLDEMISNGYNINVFGMCTEGTYFNESIESVMSANDKTGNAANNTGPTLLQMCIYKLISLTSSVSPQSIDALISECTQFISLVLLPRNADINLTHTSRPSPLTLALSINGGENKLTTLLRSHGAK